MPDGYRDAEMPDLRISEHFVHFVDRAAGDAALVERFDPLARGLAARELGDLPVTLRTVLRAQCAGRVFGPGQQLLGAERFAQTLPHELRGGGNVDVAISGREYSDRNLGRVIVAELRRHFLAHEPARGLKVEHSDHRLQQRHPHPLPLARNLALEQRGQDSHCALVDGARVGDRDAGAHRSLAGRSANPHQTPHPLRDLIETRARRIGPILPEPGNARVDEPRVGLLQGFVIDAEAELHVRPEVFHDDIGALGAFAENGDAFRVPEVARDAALIAGQVLKVRVVPVALPGVAHRQPHRGFDHDDVGAPIRELAHAGRAGAHAGQINGGKAGQRPAPRSGFRHDQSIFAPVISMSFFYYYYTYF